LTAAMARKAFSALLIASALLLMAPAPAFAHASEQGIVLLLPTGYYILGGTLAVAASFLLLLLVPSAAMARLAAARIALAPMPRIPCTATSSIAFLVLLLLLAAGIFGSHDPLENPLPLTVWTLWWGGFTIAQALFGDLWSYLNPWSGPYRLLQRLGARPLLAYPARLGRAPATILFLAFAWFELVDPAPDNPPRLALILAVYWAATMVGILLFGEQSWRSKAECFTAFFGFVARISPLRTETDKPAEKHGRLKLAFPGLSLALGEPLSLGSALFVLLSLASVSFDGLSRTFWWLGLGGINPLEFPGRTALIGRNSIGLVGIWAALTAAYALSVALGARLAGPGSEARGALGAFVLSILPISIAYHFAHYLPSFLANIQYTLLALNDPLERGWDLFGWSHAEPSLSFLSDYASVSIIWKLQAAAVVLGHLLAISLAHLAATKRHPGRRAAILSELPLAAFMVAYTCFGLWLLAAPSYG
jgi:hypothetical protein